MHIADVAKEDWSSHLAWTNLYKLSPAATGNPSGMLREAQQEACIKILEAELVGWKPKRILFLTGIDWANPFLKKMGISWKPATQAYVEATAYHDCPIVIAKHPQGKPEKKWVAEVIGAFEQLG